MCRDVVVSSGKQDARFPYGHCSDMRAAESV